MSKNTYMETQQAFYFGGFEFQWILVISRTTSVNYETVHTVLEIKSNVSHRQGKCFTIYTITSRPPTLF